MIVNASTAARCPLCSSHSPLLDTGLASPGYHLCPVCQLISMAAADHPTPVAEHQHYLTHENSPDDPGYRRFLSQLWQPLSQRLPRDAQGLDYGSGPGPTLHLMAREQGFTCDHYDPIFHPNKSFLNTHYDFITCSETAEHFHHPHREFARLHAMLRPGGLLGVMTLLCQSPESFSTWHYRRDPTHTCFYQPATFSWIAHTFGFAEPEIIGKRVILLCKPQACLLKKPPRAGQGLAGDPHPSPAPCPGSPVCAGSRAPRH